MTGSSSSSNRSTLSTSQQGVNYNSAPSVATGQLNDGDEFILIRQTRQSDEPQIWSSGDPQQTQHMFKQVQSKVDNLETTG